MSDIFKSKEIYKNGWDSDGSKYKMYPVRGFYVAGLWVEPIFKDSYVKITNIGSTTPLIRKFEDREASTTMSGVELFDLSKKKTEITQFTVKNIDIIHDSIELFDLDKTKTGIISYTTENPNLTEKSVEIYDINKSPTDILNVSSISCDMNDSEIKILSIAHEQPSIEKSLGGILQGEP